MKITMAPTHELCMVNDSIPCRVWEGTTEAGVPVRVLVVGLQVPEGSDFAEFDEGLLPAKTVEVRPRDPSRN